jgi:hypothetical protein
MRKKLAIGLAAGAVATALAGGTSVFAAAGTDDGDVTVTGPEADRAIAAALAATGGGRANAVERDSENGATWEVEVTKPDGTTVDVRLDNSLSVVVIEGDNDAAEGTHSVD